MKPKKVLVIVFLCLLLMCSGCFATSDSSVEITAWSADGMGAVVNFNGQALFLLNGMLYTFDASADELQLFCDNDQCEHSISEDLTEPSSCPAALGKGYVIGSYKDSLYAAVQDSGWNLYQYSDDEKCFKPLDHIWEIADTMVCAFHEKYFYYFSRGSLKRVELMEGGKSEIVLENMADDEYYTLDQMAFFDDLLVMSGGNVSTDTWIYDMNSENLTKVDFGSGLPQYYGGKLYYINEEKNPDVLSSYTVETGEEAHVIQFTSASGNRQIAVDKDYIYITVPEDMQTDGMSGYSGLEVYTHDGRLVKEVSLDTIPNDTMKTVMCSNDTDVFLGNSNAVSDQTLYMIDKAALAKAHTVELLPLLSGKATAK